MDEAQKARILEEAKQRTFFDIVEKTHQGTNSTDAVQLRDEIVKVGIAEAGTLKGVVDHIFNKALSDPSTSATLADVCQLMPAHFDPVEAAPAPKEKGAGSRGTSEKRIDFRLMVLKKMKDEIEKGAAALKAIKEWEAKEGEGELKGDVKKAAEVDRAAHRRFLNAVNFSGALYNTGIATEKVVHGCIDTLLKETEARSEDMEALCSLLKAIGVKMDGTSRSSKDGKIVSEYFKRIEKIKDEAASKDIADMMEEVLTLRSKGWSE